jgi:hypothetical protein
VSRCWLRRHREQKRSEPPATESTGSERGLEKPTGFVSVAGGSVTSPFCTDHVSASEGDLFRVGRAHLVQIGIGVAMIAMKFADRATDWLGRAMPTAVAGQTLRKERHGIIAT